MTNILQGKIIRRVKRVYYLKRVIAPIALKSICVIAALYALGEVVFVARVVENISSFSSTSNLLMFFTRAFIHTESIVQIISVSCVLFGGWLVWDISQKIRLLHAHRVL